MKLAPTSGTRLYCELSTGKFPCVAHRGAQFQLERQAVGLVPLPKAGTTACNACGLLPSVAHTAFECSALSGPRTKNLNTLDKARSDLGIDGSHKWWKLDDTTKLKASFCPSRGTVPTPMERRFFSLAASSWGVFYDEAGIVLTSQTQSETAPDGTNAC